MFSLGVRWIWAVTSSQFYWWCYILFAGTWRVSLDPVEAGGPYSVTAVTQSGTATLTDVLFGDVWLCGGQSNMYFKTSEVKRLRSVTSTWTDSLRGRETKAFHSSIILTLYLLMCSLQIFNTSEELILAAKYPHVRPFMVALNMSDTELTDLIEVELPWSVPTAGTPQIYWSIHRIIDRFVCS